MTEATRGPDPLHAYPTAPDLDSLRHDIATTYGRCLHELHAAEAASLVGDSHSRDLAAGRVAAYTDMVRRLEQIMGTAA